MYNHRQTVKAVVHHLDGTDGHGFEAIMIELFRRQGFNVERGPLSGDEGRDLILRNRTRVVVVECKHHRAVIGRPVIQKLHSAAITFPGATGAILAATSSFSDAAIQYARTVNEQGGIVLDLWDYQRLFEEAQRVNLFLPRRSQGTAYYFSVVGRTKGDLQNAIWNHYFARMESSPLLISDVVQLTDIHEELAPVVLVEYKIDKAFETQAGVIHHALRHGLRFFGARGDELNHSEVEYWGRSRFTLLPVGDMWGSPLAVHFRLVPADCETTVRQEASLEASCNTSYVGRNNQVYWKDCIVAPNDVELTTRQVVLVRKRQWLRFGTKTVSLLVADDADRAPALVGAEGIDAVELEALAQGDAVLCNDCGRASSRRGQRPAGRCRRCHRTLCHDHLWMYPRRSSLPEPLCSGCYRAAPYARDGLAIPPSYDRSAVKSLLYLSVIPGVAFLVMNHLLTWAVLTAAWLGLVALGALMSIPAALAGQVLATALSVCVTFPWVSRLRTHQRNLEALRSYQPLWVPNDASH